MKGRRLLSGLKTRVILTYLVIFLVCAAIMAGRAGSLFATMAMQTAGNDLEVQAILLASALDRPWAVQGDEGPLIPQLQVLTGRFAEGAGGQLTILDGQGEPLATSAARVPSNQAATPEVQAALSGAVAHDVRYDAATRQRMIYAAAPVRRANRVLGIVQLAVPVAAVTSRTHAFWFSLGLTALLAALAAALAGWLLADQLVRPVARLRNAATRLAAGHLSERVPETSTGGVAEITELAEAFNDMAARIEEMIVKQRAFVANASHELRTPLTNIKLRAEALGNGAMDDPTVSRKFVRDIESEANRLSRMANDLLSLTRQDATPSQAREPVDLAALIADMTSEMSVRADKLGVTLSQQIDPALPVVEADPSGMQTVLLNLIDNALQYTPAGGAVVVRAYPEANGQSVVLQVADTGAGIAAEDLPHIFERFYRADKARSRRMGQQSNGSALAGSGAGLGLAIVNGVVREHGGTVSAESVVGQGTTITVKLPIHPVASGAA